MTFLENPTIKENTGKKNPELYSFPIEIVTRTS